jgi:hypothetical protein
LTFRPQREAFLQKYPFASARALAQHFLTSQPTIQAILQRKLGLKKILAALGAPFSPSAAFRFFLPFSASLPRSLDRLAAVHS